MANEKIKIKLSELTDLYDIEDDKQEVKTDVAVIDNESTFEETITYFDKKLEKEFDEEL